VRTCELVSNATGQVGTEHFVCDVSVQGALEPLDGMVKRHNHLRIGQYHQHLTELLEPELTPLEYMMREFKDVPIEKMRSVVGCVTIGLVACVLLFALESDTIGIMPIRMIQLPATTALP